MKLNTEVKKAIRTLSYTISSILYRDVGLISKLYNATSRQELKNTLSEMFFKIYKNATKEETYSISPEKYEKLLEYIDSDNWREIKALLVAFICIYSINIMNKKNKDNN